MVPYSIHVALLLGVCLLFYKLLLQKETYYHLNRWILLVCLALAFVLPLVPVPQKLSLRSAPVEAIPETPPVATVAEELNKSADAIAIPATKPVLQQNEPKIQAATPVAKPESTIQFNRENIIKWTIWLYWAGVIVFAGNFLLQIIALLYQAYKKPVIRDGYYRIVELDDDKAPCSFGNNIFINPSKYDWETYKQILLHEKVHVQQGHTVDLVLAELTLVLQWFNPFAWLYRKEMENNLEFLTDDAIIRQYQVEPEEYQISLLKVSVPNYAMHVTTSYNQSLLKKRILMMNTKRSNIHTSWKYFMLAPLLVILVCGLNEQAASSASPKDPKLNSVTLPNGKTIRFKKDTTITMKVANGKVVYFNNAPGKVSVNNPSQKNATVTMKVENGKVVYLSNAPGKIAANKSAPQKAIVTADFAESFKDAGYQDLSPEALQELANWNITPDYIKGFNDIGYKDLSINTIKALSNWSITPGYVKSFMDIGYDVKLSTLQTLSSWGLTASYVKSFQNIHYNTSLQTLQTLSSWGLTASYIQGFKDIGYDVSLPTLQSLSSWGITPSYVKGFKQIGYKDVSLATLQSFTSWGITPSFIKGFMDIGYKDLSPKTLQGFIGSGVTPSFIKGFSNYKELPASKITASNDGSDVGNVVKREPITAESTNAFKHVDYEALRDRKLEALYRDLRKHTLVLKPIFSSTKIGSDAIKPDLQLLESKLAKAQPLYNAEALKNAKSVTEFAGYPNLQKAYAAWGLAVQNIATYSASEAYLNKVQKMSADELSRYQYYVDQMANGLNFTGIKSKN